MKYNLANRLCDIKKKYRIKNYIEFTHVLIEEKDEPYRKGKRNFCDAQILMKLSNNNKFELINRNYILLENLSSECINLSFKKSPET